MEEIRASMGVCPQHDILFDDLTVREHLDLFANFKGMDPKDIPTAIEQSLADVDLAMKADDRA
jgi:ATP-binding cassette, subfamily A (ABC1), member 3